MAATLQLATPSRTDPLVERSDESVISALEARGLVYSLIFVEEYTKPRLTVNDDQYGFIAEYIGASDILSNLDNVEQYVRDREDAPSTTFQTVSAIYDSDGTWQTANVTADDFVSEEDAITWLFEHLAEHVTHGIRKREYRSEHYDGFTRYFIRPSNWWATLETLTPATDDVMRAPDTY